MEKKTKKKREMGKSLPPRAAFIRGFGSKTIGGGNQLGEKRGDKGGFPP